MLRSPFWCLYRFYTQLILLLTNILAKGLHLHWNMKMFKCLLFLISNSKKNWSDQTGFLSGQNFWPDKRLVCGQKLFVSFSCFNVIIKTKNHISCLWPVCDPWPVSCDPWPVAAALKRRTPDETGVLAIIESWIKFLFFPLFVLLVHLRL